MQPMFAYQDNTLRRIEEKLTEILRTDQFSIAGGFVRDTLLGVKPRDIDVVMTCIPKHIINETLDGGGFHDIKYDADSGYIRLDLIRLPAIEGYPVEVMSREGYTHRMEDIARYHSVGLCNVIYERGKVQTHISFREAHGRQVLEWNRFCDREVHPEVFNRYLDRLADKYPEYKVVYRPEE